jgi:hypothetical protein
MAPAPLPVAHLRILKARRHWQLRPTVFGPVPKLRKVALELKHLLVRMRLDTNVQCCAKRLQRVVKEN